MASITDCVAEGLKYPFGNVKRILVFGVMLAAVSVLNVLISVRSFAMFRKMTLLIEDNHLTSLSKALPQVPAGDIYVIVALGIIIFVVFIFIFGYQYRIVDYSIERKEDLPGFTNIIGMFADGIRYFIVCLAYNIVPAVVMIAGLTIIGNSSALMVVELIAFILFIIAFFLQIMALNNMIAHDSIAKAFDVREITGHIANLGWGKYIGIIIFTLIVFMIVSTAAGFILSFITVGISYTVTNKAVEIAVIIAAIEGLLVNSYLAVFYNRVCGAIYREAIK